MNRNLVTLCLLVVTLFAGGTAAKAEISDSNVFTMWWVVFNNPEACATSPCGEPDLFVPEVEASVLYASATVATRANVNYVAALYESGDSVFDIDGNTSVVGGPGLKASRDAEIHLVLRDHGPAIPGLVDQQMTEFMDPGCSDVGGPNTCVDAQYTVFLAGAEDITQSEMFRFTDGSTVEGSRAMLVRQDGLVKAIVLTELD